ncbi:MAG TPA: tetratricopeptide repeat protein, partial [Tepidisphaeraceae bacterium]|nr:tetratricopeptide repeat protein [Tepidisphaeraceae bacterium]
MSLDETFNLAVQAHQGGKLHEAAELYLKILTRQPNHAGALHGTGLMAHQVGRHDAAMQYLVRAIAADGTKAEYHFHLGAALEAMGQRDQAMAEMRQAIKLRPDYPEALSGLGAALLALGRAKEAADLFGKARQLHPENTAIASDRFLALHRLAGEPHRLLLELKDWNRRGADALRLDRPPYQNSLEADRRLRIGYLAVDFREPAISRAILPLLSHHDRSRFEIYAYSCRPGDGPAEPLQRHVDTWRNIAQMTDEQAAEFVHFDQIDVLVDLSLHAPGNRMPVLARKPAPVQAVYLSHLGTSGMAAMGGRFSDPHLDPPGSDLSIYSEVTVRLPYTYFCYQADPLAPEVVESPVKLKGHVTYGCLADFALVSASALGTWGKILQATPNSRLLVRCPAGTARSDVLGRLPRGRVDFVGELSPLDQLKAWQKIDVALDPFPCGNAMAICDALWMGVPVVTLAGATAAGRVGASVLANIGRPQWIAASAEDYVRIAADWRSLLESRNSLRKRMSASRLMDAALFARDFERGLEFMWDTWRLYTAGRPNEAVRKLIDAGIKHQRAKEYDQAEAIYRQVLAEDPQQHEAVHLMGNMLSTRESYDESIEWLRKAQARRPAEPGNYGLLGDSHMPLGRVDEAYECYRRALELRPDARDYDSGRLFAAHLHPGIDAMALLRAHQEWNWRHAEPLAGEIRPHDNTPDPNRRLRLGYVSADFRAHVVGHNLLRFFGERDREQYEVFCYSSVTEPDSVTDDLKKHADGWREIGKMSDAEAAETVREDRIDVLVELSLHTEGHRLLLFARKPAPVQVSYLGYCSTTGLRTIDYRLSDPYIDPPGADVSCYTERTFRMPATYWCYRPGIAKGSARQSPALAGGQVTFGSMNKFAKVSPATQDLWARVLAAVPNSRMIVHAPPASCRAALLERFAVRGVAADRVEFIGSQSYGDYIRTYYRIDIALDPFPWGGGITTCDALWMGVPVITLRGRTAVGRGSVSVLCNLG